MKEQINSILKKVGLKAEEIKLETVTVGEGEATLEAEVFEPGEPVFVVDGEQRIPLPVGDYKLDDGRILKVAEEGVIAEIGEPAAEEDPAMEEEAAMSDKQEQPLPKAIIESVVKETKFSKEDMETIDNLKAEIETLKTELAAMKEEPKKEDLEETTDKVVEEKTEEVELKKITPNPEKENPASKVLFSQKRSKTTLDSVLEKLAK